MDMKFSRIVASVIVVIATTSISVAAHHSFAAEFDAARPVKLRGTVVRMEWINPHSWIHIDVKDPASGTTERWMIEGGPPGTLLRRGWTPYASARSAMLHHFNYKLLAEGS